MFRSPVAFHTGKSPVEICIKRGSVIALPRLVALGPLHHPWRSDITRPAGHTGRGPSSSGGVFVCEERYPSALTRPSNPRADG